MSGSTILLGLMACCVIFIAIAAGVYFTNSACSLGTWAGSACPTPAAPASPAACVPDGSPSMTKPPGTDCCSANGVDATGNCMAVSTTSTPGGAPGGAPGPSPVPAPMGMGSSVPTAPLTPPAVAGVSGDTATAAATLNPGDKLTSKDGQHTAVMQTDGNFVIYNGSGGATWALQTVNVPWSGPGRKAVMQTDGNFVIYNPDGSAAWATASNNSNSPSKIVMQNDGNLVVYDSTGAAKWQSGTAGK